MAIDIIIMCLTLLPSIERNSMYFFSYECFLDARCISLLYVWNKFIIPNNQTWTKQKVYLSSLLWTAAEKCSTKETATEKKKKRFFSSKIPFTLKIRTLILFPYFAFAFLFTHHCMLCFVTGKRRKGKKSADDEIDHYVGGIWHHLLVGWHIGQWLGWHLHQSLFTGNVAEHGLRWATSSLPSRG